MILAKNPKWKVQYCNRLGILTILPSGLKLNTIIGSSPLNVISYALSPNTFSVPFDPGDELQG